MDWGTVLTAIAPIVSAGLAALFSSKLVDFRLEKLEQTLEKYSNHIEELIKVRDQVDNIRQDFEDYKIKDEKDKDDIQANIRKLYDDADDLKEEVSELKTTVVRVEGKVDRLETVVQMHHSH